MANCECIPLDGYKCFWCIRSEKDTWIRVADVLAACIEQHLEDSECEKEWTLDFALNDYREAVKRHRR